MNKEEKDAIDFFIHECEKYDGTIEIKGTSVGEETRILNTIVKYLKELNSLKENEQLRQEENGKLRVEFEKVYEDNLTLANELEQEKEKNKNTGKLVENKIDGTIGIVLREWETDQIQVLEKIQPKVINTHDSWKTLEVIEDE